MFLQCMLFCRESSSLLWRILYPCGGSPLIPHGRLPLAPVAVDFVHGGVVAVEEVGVFVGTTTLGKVWPLPCVEVIHLRAVADEVLRVEFRQLVFHVG